MLRRLFSCDRIARQRSIRSSIPRNLLPTRRLEDVGTGPIKNLWGVADFRDGSKTEVAALERHVRCTLQERTSADRPGMAQRWQEPKSLHLKNLNARETQNCPVTDRRIAN